MGCSLNSKLATPPKLLSPLFRAQEIGILSFAGTYQLAIRRHHIGCKEIITAETMAATQPADAKAKGEARNTDN